ncbi:MAG: four helix bundle protein [bacterium]|nr:four helix bundle protein [bacterium]
MKNANHGFRFRDWNVYKDGRVFRKSIHILVRKFPKEELFSLIDQISRALNSILLNIAEGSNKNTDKDMALYVNRAHCSLDEVVSCLDCALDDGYITPTEHEAALAQAEHLAKQLKAFTVFLSKGKSLTKPFTVNR